MDRFEAMSIVLAVAEAGSLSAAARQQRTPLATVSRKVSELEALLQIKLFNRSTRALTPTDAGRSYIAAAKRIVADVAEAERSASGEYTSPRGELHMSAPFALGLLYLQPVVTEFLAAFPQVDVHLVFQDRAANLPEEHVDLGINIGALADSSLIAVRIGEVTRVVCASPAYLKARGKPKSPEDLSQHDCITGTPIQSPTLWWFKPGQIQYTVPVHSRLVVSNLGAACEAARAGIGITQLLSYHVGDAIKSGELVPLLRDFQPAPLPVSLVYSPNRFMPVKLRAFLDFAVPRLRARLGDLSRTITRQRGARRRA